MILRHFLVVASLIAALLAMPPQAQADDEEEAPSATDRPSSLPAPVHEGFGARAGALLNLFGPTDLASPFVYLDFGLRYKAHEYYFDLKLPALVLAIDALTTVLFDSLSSGVTLAERLNGDLGFSPGHLELGHIRLGYRFAVDPPATSRRLSRPLNAAAGVFATADVLVFELRRDVDPGLAAESGYDDPLLIAAGFFGAFGATFERLQFDLAIGAGTAVRGQQIDRERQVILLLFDLDLQFELAHGLAAYLRPRLTTYFTRLTPMATLGAGLTTGITIRL